MGAAAPIAAIAAPLIAGGLTKRGKAPSFQYTGPDRSEYIDQLLSSAFNPDDRLMNLASERANEAAARGMASRGLLGSSLGQQSLAATNASIANKFLEGEMQRRMQALESARGFDALRAGIDKANYQSQMDQYNADMEGKNNLISGVAGVAGTGLGYLGQRNIANEMAMNRDFMANRIFGTPFNTGNNAGTSSYYTGTPGYSNYG